MYSTVLPYTAFRPLRISIGCLPKVSVLKRRSRRAFTMIEVVIALGILTALAGIGWGTMQEHLPRFRLVRIAKHFRSELISMRQIAVQTNRETRFHLLAHSGGRGLLHGK